MSREVFMERLESLLAEITVEERAEALQYYADYFADAGPENEAKVIGELGSPERVAAMIKAGLKGSMEDGAFTEHGYRDERFEEKASPAMPKQKEESQKKAQNRYSYQGQETAGYQGASGYTGADGGQKGAAGDASRTGNPYGNHGYENNTYGNYGNAAYGNSPYDNPSYGKKDPPWTSRGLKILLVVLILLVAAPVVLPIAGACILGILGLVCAAFGLFLGLVITAGAVAVAGFSIVCVGITKLIAIPAMALLTIGIGILIFVIGLVATAAAIRLCTMICPAMFRFLVGICRKPFQRKARV